MADVYLGFPAALASLSHRHIYNCTHTLLHTPVSVQLCIKSKVNASLVFFTRLTHTHTESNVVTLLPTGKY